MEAFWLPVIVFILCSLFMKLVVAYSFILVVNVEII